MVKLKNRIEYLEYIKVKMLSTFKNIRILNQNYEEADGRFSVTFLYKLDKIKIDTARGYIGIEIVQGNENIDISQLDKNINNIYLSVNSIDYYIDFLKKYYELDG